MPATIIALFLGGTFTPMYSLHS